MTNRESPQHKKGEDRSDRKRRGTDTGTDRVWARHPAGANTGLTTEFLVGLQQTHGNAYVGRLLRSRAVQAKLTINPPDDIYEKEADRVAEIIGTKSASNMQRQAEPEEEEEEERVQAKLASGRLTSSIGRQVAPEKEDEEEVQAKKESAETPEVSSGLESRINASRGRGEALPDRIRRPLEPQFGRDFTSVRVHTDSEANELSRQLGARAFTTGEDIFFRSGDYQPESNEGRKLLAHELTHVAQQNVTTVRREESKATKRETTGKAAVTTEGTKKDEKAKATTRATPAKGGAKELYYSLVLRPLVEGLWDQFHAKVEEHRHYLLALACLRKASGPGADPIELAKFCKKYKVPLTLPVVGLISRIVGKVDITGATKMGVKIIASMLPLLRKIRLRNATLFALDEEIVPAADSAAVGIILETAKSPREVMEATKQKAVEVSKSKAEIEKYVVKLEAIELELGIGGRKR